jgi:hypothetical protein
MILLLLSDNSGKAESILRIKKIAGTIVKTIPIKSEMLKG